MVPTPTGRYIREIVMTKKHIVTGDQHLAIGRKLAELYRQLYQKNGYPFDLARLDEHLQAAIEGRFGAPTHYRLRLTGHETVNGLVEAGGYASVDQEFKDGSFVIEPGEAVERDAELAYFFETMETDEILAELEKRNLRPANLAEHLAFGVQYPNVQRHLPVVCLGAAWRNPANGYRYYPCLHGNQTRRNLYLTWVDPIGRWRCFYWRFLAVRK